MGTLLLAEATQAAPEIGAWIDLGSVMPLKAVAFCEGRGHVSPGVKVPSKTFCSGKGRIFLSVNKSVSMSIFISVGRSKHDK